jgi:hypothetical protein
VIRKLVLIVVAMVGGFILLLFVSGPMADAILSAVAALLTGWLFFLGRTLPAMSWNWSAIGFAALASAAILILMHRLGGWLWRSRTPATGTWRWGWTAGAFAVVWLIFGYVLATVGIAHQLGWMLSSEEPLVHSGNMAHRARLSMYAGVARHFVSEAGWDLAEFQIRIRESLAQNPAQEEMQIVPVTNAEGKMQRLLVIPRDVRLQKIVGFAVLKNPTLNEPPYDIDVRTIDALPDALDLEKH